MNDLISIIVPIYKVEKYLEECILSIINQSYKNIEIILINDGSPDSCADICDKYAKIDCRVKVIHKKNEGLSKARNYGISIAKGEYISFIDSDDWINQYMIEELYNEAIKSKSDIVVCGYEIIYSKKRKIVKCDKKELNNVEGIEFILKENSLGNYAWNKLYKKELFEGIIYPYRTNYEDLFTTYKLFMKSNKISVIDKALYYYRIRLESITKSFSNKNIESFYNAIIYQSYEIMDKYVELEEMAQMNILRGCINIWNQIITYNNYYDSIRKYNYILKILEEKKIYAKYLNKKNRIMLFLIIKNKKFYYKFYKLVINK